MLLAYKQMQLPSNFHKVLVVMIQLGISKVIAVNNQSFSILEEFMLFLHPTCRSSADKIFDTTANFFIQQL